MDEFKAIADDTLVRDEKKPTLLVSLARDSLVVAYFRTEGDTATNDTLRLCGYASVLEVGARVGFACMSCKRAPVLCLLILGKCISEIVIAVWIRT